MKYTEQELIKAYLEQKIPKLSPGFSAKVINTIRSQELELSTVFTFAKLNFAFAIVCICLSSYMLDLNDLGMEILIESGALL